MLNLPRIPPARARFGRVRAKFSLNLPEPARVQACPNLPEPARTCPAETPTLKTVGAVGVGYLKTLQVLGRSWIEPLSSGEATLSNLEPFDAFLAKAQAALRRRALSWGSWGCMPG